MKCKVCGSRYTQENVIVKGFNVGCNGGEGGRDIFYHRCTLCGFLFTDAFDTWTKEDYLREIYNDDYVKYDPDYLRSRAEANAEAIHTLIKGRCLDYGGGNGYLAELLRKRGINAYSWDPMVDAKEPMTQFQTILSFEVFEHHPDPKALISSIKRLLKPGGKVYFSTLTNGEDWYVAPRNGHISIFTKESLNHLGGLVGLEYKQFNPGFHAYASSK